MPRAVSRTGIQVAVRTDHWWPPFEKLLFVAANARVVLRIFGYVGEGVGTGTHLVPVRRRKFMARGTFHLVSGSGVIEIGITRSLWCRRRTSRSSRPRLRVNVDRNIGDKDRSDRHEQQRQT